MGNGLSISKVNKPIKPKESIVNVLAHLSDEGHIDNDVFELVREKLEYSGDLHLQIDELNKRVKENNEAIKRTKEYEKKMKLKAFQKYKKAEISQNADELKGALEVIKTQLAAKGLDTNITKQLSL